MNLCHRIRLKNQIRSGHSSSCELQVKINYMTNNLLSPIELYQRSHKTLVSSSRQLGWNGILVEQYQYAPTPNEIERPALSEHRLILPLGQPVHLTQKRDERLHESIFHKGDSIFVPAGQSSYWRCHKSDTYRPTLDIWLKPELIEQAAEASEIAREHCSLVNCFGKQDLQLHQAAMLLLAELRSGGIMGQLYVESLTQVLVIHLLRHYSTLTPTITSENRSLTHAQVQQAINYIHTHLDRDLSVGIGLNRDPKLNRSSVSTKLGMSRLQNCSIAEFLHAIA